MRWYRTGDASTVKKRQVRGTFVERFWAYVDQTGEHWMWTGVTNKKGYGVFSRGSRTDGKVLAHVASWTLAHGPVPEGLHVLHRCDIPGCVRPDCLFLGTKADNNRDMADKGRQWNQRKTHCPQGHEYSPGNTAYNKKGRLCRTCQRIGLRRRRALKRAQQ